MKKKVLFVSVLFIFSLIITGCGVKKEVMTDALKFKNEYEKLNGKSNDVGKDYRKIKIKEDNPFVYATASEIVQKMEEQKTFAVYFGYSSCPWCRSVVPTLIDVCSDLKLSQIYYVDIQEIRDILALDQNGEVYTEKKGSNGYYQLLSQFDSVLSDYELTDDLNHSVSTGEKRIYAPNVISVVHGIPKKIETGISQKQTDSYMKLSDEMIQDTYNKFKCTLECLDEKNTCSNEKSC